MTEKPPHAVPGPAPTRSTSPTTTTNGAARSPTTTGSSRSSASKVSSPASPGSPSSESATASAKSSTISTSPSVAQMGERDIERLLQDPGIIRHRGKIASTINNAKRALEIAAEFGSLAAYIWRFEPPPSKLIPVAGDDPAPHRRLARPQQGPAQTRLLLRRPHHLLRLHAGDGPRQRPRRRLLLPQGMREGTQSAEAARARK